MGSFMGDSLPLCLGFLLLAVEGRGEVGGSQKESFIPEGHGRPWEDGAKFWHIPCTWKPGAYTYKQLSMNHSLL